MKIKRERKGVGLLATKWLRKRAADWVAFVVMRMLDKMWGF